MSDITLNNLSTVKHYIQTKVLKTDAIRSAKIGSANWFKQNQQEKASTVI